MLLHEKSISSLHLGYIDSIEIIGRGSYKALGQWLTVLCCISDTIMMVIQWNLIITVTLGPNLSGCYIEVAFLLSGIQNHHN